MQNQSTSGAPVLLTLSCHSLSREQVLKVNRKPDPKSPTVALHDHHRTQGQACENQRTCQEEPCSKPTKATLM